MLSDEERKVIEYLKRHIIPVYGRKGQIEYLLNDIVLNLIEKQSKEIEDNKKYIDLHYVPYEQYVSTTNGIDKKWKDKIKAKIEEVDKDENASIPDFIEYAKEYATQKLQSLLEKE